MATAIRDARGIIMVLPALEILVWLLAGVLLVPVVVLVTECLASLLPRRAEAPAPTGARPPCAVLVPAHDEEEGIGRTLACVLPQLQPADRLIVVADNCADGTAAAARAGGATVVERTDPVRRGKGFALDFGVRSLEAAPPEVVVIVDADCVVQAGSIEWLVREAAASGRPVQAVNLLDTPPGGGIRDQLSGWAFQCKNLVRPLGLDRLGLPCLITTGMAFPWPVIRDAELASGHIAEDMQLGVDLAVAGYPARLCLRARVNGQLPSGARAAAVQRTRWEHGHMQTLLTQVPRLVRQALAQRRLDLLGLALELSVPPLSMLFLLSAVLEIAAGGLWQAGGSGLPALVLALGGLASILALFAAWVKFGRQRLPLTSLLAAPFYVLWKVPIYLAFGLRRQRAWIRTKRSPLSQGGTPEA